ncbi:MAG TPA: ferritin-like domain-containing protein [Syntrophales bacterium]|nr:ferritin-like domain-containing protein [Syntrophales bacterium]HPQ43852.1 ferritin-like domain-containing protein [Syntrophales bacterium]
MEKKALIDMLNRDLTDEHAAVVRYLIHSYQEGEDTPVGASLLSRCREEMWHMHWLGMIIGELGGEPDFSIGPYPFDPSSRATLLKSYIRYEEKLIPHYNAEAEKVDDPHIRRVLRREAWESAIHARRFQRLLEKLSPEDANALPQGDQELPGTFVEKLQKELLNKYTEMLQHIRNSWVFQNEAKAGWSIMDQAMEKMKHLAIFAEALAEDGAALPFKPGSIDMSRAVGDAFQKAIDDLKTGGERYRALQKDDELRKHAGIVLKVDLAVQQIDYQKEEIGDWLKK